MRLPKYAAPTAIRFRVRPAATRWVMPSPSGNPRPFEGRLDDPLDSLLPLDDEDLVVLWRPSSPRPNRPKKMVHRSRGALEGSGVHRPRRGARLLLGLKGAKLGQVRDQAFRRRGTS